MLIAWQGTKRYNLRKLSNRMGYTYVRTYVYSEHPEMQTRLKWVSALYIFWQNEADFNHRFFNIQESRPYGHLFQRLISSTYLSM